MIVRRLLLAVLAIGFMASWMGCSAQRRYRVLSVFFDGVPDPNAPASARGGVVGPGGAVARITHVHKPYADGNCNACHVGGTDSIFRTSSGLNIDSDVCLKCHAKVINQFAVMHGPVSSVECLRCHTPHESNTEHLLASSSPRVCVQCHVPELLSPKPPEHLDKTADCLTCHYAHGGAKHGLLKQSTTRPATQPTSAPKIAVAANYRPERP